MKVDDKALKAAIAWYWRAGAISENIPRGCIREYLANLPKEAAKSSEQPVQVTQSDVDRANGWGVTLGLDLCRFMSEEKIELRSGKSAFETCSDIVAFVVLAKEHLEALQSPMRVSIAP